MMKTQHTRISPCWDGSCAKRAVLRNRVSEETGQAAAVVALFLFFVFLAFASLGIDGAAVYLTRRDLQNVADASALAACRTVADGGDNDANVVLGWAREAALRTVLTNLQSYDAIGGNPPTNVGAGPTLLQGLEVSDPDVRVALRRPAPTVLTQFLGRDQTLVTAQARCDSRAGGGLLPIAVQRYDGEDGGSLRDYLGNKSASNTAPNPPPVPYPTDSVTETWDGRYGPFQVPVPMPQYITSDGAVTDPQTGPEVVLLGQGADTNNGVASMRGFVLLDIRNVASQNALEYYNGATGQANVNKDMSQGWIYQHGYPGPYPQVGSQVAILDGVSNNFAAGAMQDAGYKVGDVVAVIIYDGFVWSTPDYAVVMTPDSAVSDSGVIAGYPTNAGTAVVYDVNIAKVGPRPWFATLDFSLVFDFSNEPVPPGLQMTIDGFPVTPGVVYAVNGVAETGWTGEMRIWNTDPITVVTQYLSGLNLIVDSSLGATRGASTNFGFGTIGAEDYTLRTSAGRRAVRQGASATLSMVTYGAGSALPAASPGCSAPAHMDLLLNGVEQAWGSYFSSPQDTTVNIQFDTDNPLPNNFSVDALLNAPTTPPGSTHAVRFTVPWMGTCSGIAIPPHTVEIPITILPPASNATPNRFVFIQGYANFRISRVDTNTVWGYAISPLYPTWQQVRYGLRARLVPWN